MSELTYGVQDGWIESVCCAILYNRIYPKISKRLAVPFLSYKCNKIWPSKRANLQDNERANLQDCEAVVYAIYQEFRLGNATYH